VPEPQRIAKLLARAGIASRREVERMIAEGRIALNGAALDTPATLLASLDGVTVDGQPVAAPAPARLFLYHKPPGLLVTERDPRGRPTIYDRLPKGLPRVVPVGRLDLATEGLLLLTTDGGLKRQLELPATGVERAYRARAYGQVGQAQLEELIQGVTIDGVRYGKIDANLERRTGANVWIELVLTEGKNREVRRVLQYLGLEVSRLIRTRYGPFALGDLPAGAVAEVRPQDVAAFRSQPTRTDLAVRARLWVPEAAKAAPPPPGEASKTGDKRPGRPGKPRKPAAGDTIAKPARAARARAHRAATGREAAPAAPPREPARGPRGGRSKPRPGGARSPRTRK
jgi:23S rRNA pseudouridine2605 synthase